MITMVLLLSTILLLNNGVRLVNGQCPYYGTELVDDTTYASHGGNNSLIVKSASNHTCFTVWQRPPNGQH